MSVSIDSSTAGCGGGGCGGCCGVYRDPEKSNVICPGSGFAGNSSLGLVFQSDGTGCLHGLLPALFDPENSRLLVLSEMHNLIC